MDCFIKKRVCDAKPGLWLGICICPQHMNAFYQENSRHNSIKFLNTLTWDAKDVFMMNVRGYAITLNFSVLTQNFSTVVRYFEDWQNKNL